MVSKTEDKDIRQKYYLNVTNEWLTNAKPNSHKIKISKYYIYNNIKYNVDGKHIVLDYSSKERNIALWLEKKFGGEIYILPKINYPKNIKTPDYLFRNEKWDLKTMTEKAVSKTRAVDNIIKSSRFQTDNIILDITNTTIDKENIIKQVKKVFSTSGREWLKVVIVIDDYNLIGIYKRK